MPKVEDYKITLMENTRNWSDEIQPAVDLIASLDGDLGDISDIDLSLASSITKNDNVFKSSKIFQEFGGFFDSKEETNIKLALLDLLKSELSDNSLLYPLLRVEYTDGNSHSLLGSLEKVKDLLLSLKLTLEIKGDITPQEKMELLDAVIRLNGFNPSTKAMLNTLSENIFGNSYNCLSYSLIGYIIGQEMKWPVSMVITRNHAYLRWDDGKVAFNFDQGEIHSDEHYKNQFDTFPEK
ncbi:hypothetical protein KKA47_02330, partial [bacterium]|nr:hypothetical protein [bacterium]